MAVDSQRNIFHFNTVTADDIGLIMTAQSYRPAITTAVRQIKEFGEYQVLQSLCNQPIRQGKSPIYADCGHPCLKTRHIVNILASKENLDYATKDSAQRGKQYAVGNENILMNRSGAGSIGRVSIYFGSDKPLTDDHLFKIVIALPNDPAYVCCFLASWWGERAIEQRISGTTGQLNLSSEHVQKLPIPIPDRLVQNYIGDKVRLAEKLRERSKELEIVIKEKMQECFAGNPKPRPSKHNTVIADFLTANRLEYDFYKPLAIWAYEEIRGSQWQYKKLVDFATRIKDGPGGWGVSTKDYVDSGIPVIRAINLINGECNLSDCIFISEQKHQELASHKVNSNSVLLSVRGTIGRAAVFYADEYKEANLNAAVVTIDCKDSVLPEFLAEFLNTEVGKIQSQRMANGGVQLNMNLEETGNNLIVIPPKIFQEKIADLRQHRILIKELSEKLTTAAKYLVEALIEGKLTETELKNAQTALQKGDIEPDKAILAKLTRKGYDISDEPPLFPDLDSLYQAIKEIDLISEL